MSKKGKTIKTGTLIAGSLLVAEGAALALYGTRYLVFMEKYGLLDAGKAAIRKLKIESPVVLAAVGAAEAFWGLSMLRTARG